MRIEAICILALSFGASSHVSADDWRQFMRDEYRSNASRDRVTAPLTAIWTSPRSGGVSQRAYVGWKNPCVVNRGRAYHITLAPGAGRVVEQIDARTGLPDWSFPLNALPGRGNLAGNAGSWVAVTQSGHLAMYDYLPARRSGAQPSPQDAPPVRNGSVIGNPVVRYLRPDTRQIVDEIALLSDFRVPVTNAADSIFHTYLTDWPFPKDQFTVVESEPINPGNPYHGVMLPDVTIPGPPLISGDEIAATSDLTDLFFRWSPFQLPQFIRLTHVHPRNRDALPGDLPTGILDHFPMARLPAGYLIGTGAEYRHLTAYNPQSRDGRPILWHRDWHASLGIPSVDGQSIFMGSHGPFADGAINALDTKTGKTRWTYPSIAGAEPVREGMRKRIKVALGYGKSVLVPGSNPRGSSPSSKRDNRTGGGPGTASSPVNIEVNIWSVGAPYVGAHRLNRGLITTKGKVIGFTTDRLVCLDQATGKEHWSTLIALSRRVDSMAGSQSHVYFSLRRTAKTPAELRAYRLDNGKLDWQQTVEASGSISIASGLVLVASEGQVRAYGPAERTFKLAIDSKVPTDYRPIRYHEERDEGDTDEERARRSLDPTRAIEPETEERPEQASARANAMGEMAILRFRWGRPVSEMVREIRERQRLLPGVPLVLSIDWLDAKRAALLSPSRGKWWTPAELESFAVACSQLTHAARPEYIDIAPELNVYLARYPELSDPALAFVQQVGHAVKSANPSTRVIASFNAELLLDRYGKTDYLPFGAVPRPRPWKLSRLEPILLAMDSIGITLRPQTGFVFPVDVPSNYLFPLREWFGKKPLLITAIDVKADIDVKKNGGDKQRDFLEQSLKTCYWMETRLIAVRLDGEGAEDEALALRSAKSERPALEAWRHVNSWRLVNFLTSELALAKREATPQFPD